MARNLIVHWSFSPEVKPAQASSSSTSTAAANATSSESSDPKKKLRNLKKKLTDIETLQSRLDSGDLKNPEPEQLEKLKRRNQIESEIREMEALLRNL